MYTCLGEKRFINDTEDPSDPLSPTKKKNCTQLDSITENSPKKDTETLLKFLSWNVNSLKRVLERKQLVNLVSQEDPDFICLQETKLTEDKVPGAFLLPQYKKFFNCCETKRGYSGTALFSKMAPIAVLKDFEGVYSEHNKTGRLIVAEYENFYVASVYVPNSGDKLKNLEYRVHSWDPSFCSYICELQMKKPIVLLGDLNVAHQDIDVYAPERLGSKAGFVQSERNNFSKFLEETKMVDSFRYLYPHRKEAYSFWDYKTGGRLRNQGWRIDYCLLSSSLVSNLVDAFILDKIEGSDHCPIGIQMRIF
ncbi:Exodeoxyribonuclease [Galdieria sulphuraria]|uniref:Exodeoxyribonuclease III n=1 Tax=Galdieria sulphuraria TaxID=130081 RepID=M2XVM9_GALSU|nr:exodeoxyribonuclease III [Galdieria sulphuraria]EME27464.1 exodeoxyribonuclease III [Galdieria sulphuraria]GJD06481.1 Exodeoxyribonuclease [Galdieria sulphuraria]|eukprot:XP_005703984.1 exodeoxyribonuclease III [Galdieria sulphuraria]